MFSAPQLPCASAAQYRALLIEQRSEQPAVSLPELADTVPAYCDFIAAGRAFHLSNFEMQRELRQIATKPETRIARLAPPQQHCLLLVTVLQRGVNAHAFGDVERSPQLRNLQRGWAELSTATALASSTMAWGVVLDVASGSQAGFKHLVGCAIYLTGCIPLTVIKERKADNNPRPMILVTGGRSQGFDNAIADAISMGWKRFHLLLGSRSMLPVDNTYPSTASQSLRQCKRKSAASSMITHWKWSSSKGLDD